MWGCSQEVEEDLKTFGFRNRKSSYGRRDDLKRILEEARDHHDLYSFGKKELNNILYRETIIQYFLLHVIQNETSYNYKHLCISCFITRLLFIFVIYFIACDVFYINTKSLTLSLSHTRHTTQLWHILLAAVYAFWSNRGKFCSQQITTFTNREQSEALQLLSTDGRRGECRQKSRWTAREQIVSGVADTRQGRQRELLCPTFGWITAATCKHFGQITGRRIVFRKLRRRTETRGDLETKRDRLTIFQLVYNVWQNTIP